jgi:HlyD family secretion protein
MLFGSGKINRLLRTAAKLILAVAIVGGIVYQVYFAPVIVTLQPVGTGTVVAEVMGTGTLEARVRIAISPKISGRLVNILVDQGSTITAGQLLATLDDSDLTQQVAVASAEVALAQATVDRSATDIVRAQATLKLAQRELARMDDLRKSNSATAFELEQATERQAVAEADTTRARLAKIEAEQAVAKAQASLRYFEARLQDTKIVAPFAGLVVRRNRDPGDVVVPGSAILDVVATNELWVSAWVDESALTQLTIAQPARVQFRAAPEQALPGKVVRLASQTDRETREFLVEVSLAEWPKSWTIGQRAEIYIETGRRLEVVAIPQRYVIWREGKAGVMVEQAGKAQWQLVTLGLRGRENVEVTSGLNIGQRLISVPTGTELPRVGRALRYPPS